MEVAGQDCSGKRRRKGKSSGHREEGFALIFQRPILQIAGGAIIESEADTFPSPLKHPLTSRSGPATNGFPATTKIASSHLLKNQTHV
jgi:hypothetical protein